MGLGLQIYLEGKTIAPHQAACRMQHHGMAGSFFRIKGSLHFQRSLDKDAIGNCAVLSLGIV
jgi:hypothetical protein